MEKEFVPTVHISVEEYESLKRRVATLTEQVQEKTIYKYVSRLQEFADIMPIVCMLVICIGWMVVCTMLSL